MDRSWIPTVAGILDIVSGVASLFGFVGLTFATLVLHHVKQPDEDFPFYAVEILLGCFAFLVLVAAILCFAGGVSAIQRRSWGWAVAGSAAAAFMLPPAGIAAIILTVIGEKEIRGEGPPPGSV